MRSAPLSGIVSQDGKHYMDNSYIEVVYWIQVQEYHTEDDFSHFKIEVSQEKGKVFIRKLIKYVV